MSSCSIENQNPNLSSSSSPLDNWSNLWSKNKKALTDHALFTSLRRRSFYRKPPLPENLQETLKSPNFRQVIHQDLILKVVPDTLYRDLSESGDQSLKFESLKNETLTVNSGSRQIEHQDEILTVVPDTLYRDVSESGVGSLKNESLTVNPGFCKNDGRDYFLKVSDDTLHGILSKCGDGVQVKSNSLVSKKWMEIEGGAVRCVKVKDWSFISSGRVFIRFPNVIDVDLVNASVVCDGFTKRCGLSVGREFRPFCVGCDVFVEKNDSLLGVSEVDIGLKSLASKYPNLQRLVVVNCSEIGLLDVAERCVTLQELVLHKCNDQVLRAIAGFENLQILKLIGSVDGFYSSLVSDIGLTILAQGCKRLVKLELRGCEGSYDGIRAIGQCCQMLEELTFCDHRMDDGWLSGVSFCENLKSLRLVSCKRIDANPGLDEHLGCCRMLERLHLERCQLRDKQSLRAVFFLCRSVKEMVIKDCWGLKDGMFLNACLCRRLKFLSLDGCSRLTTEGLESVVLSLKELESLMLISCKNIKDNEVSPALSTLFYTLKNLRWTPDNRSLLSTSLLESGIGKRGGKFFKRVANLEHLKLGI